jgi:hypothetical protein
VKKQKKNKSKLTDAVKHVDKSVNTANDELSRDEIVFIELRQAISDLSGIVDSMLQNPEKSGVDLTTLMELNTVVQKVQEWIQSNDSKDLPGLADKLQTPTKDLTTQLNILETGVAVTNTVAKILEIGTQIIEVAAAAF